MAGHGPHLLREDAAFEKYNKLMVYQHHAYKFNKKSALYAALFLGVIPGIGIYYSYKWEGKTGNIFWGSRRTEPVYAQEWTPRK